MEARHTRGDEFSRLVYQILVVEKRRAIRDVAASVGMEYASFHARVIGRTHFKAEEVSRLIAEVPDPRLCDYLLRNTIFVAVPKPASTVNPKQNAFQAAVQLATEGMATLGHLGETLLNGQFDQAGYEHLSNHIREAERAVGTLRASLIALMPRNPRLSDTRPALSGGPDPIGQQGGKPRLAVVDPAMDAAG
jgi:hypothetical protein